MAVAAVHIKPRKNFGFVELYDSADVDTAIQGLNNSNLHGREIFVEEAKEEIRLSKDDGNTQSEIQRELQQQLIESCLSSQPQPKPPAAAASPSLSVTLLTCPPAVLSLYCLAVLARSHGSPPVPSTYLTVFKSLPYDAQDAFLNIRLDVDDLISSSRSYPSPPSSASPLLPPDFTLGPTDEAAASFVTSLLPTVPSSPAFFHHSFSTSLSTSSYMEPLRLLSTLERGESAISADWPDHASTVQEMSGAVGAGLVSHLIQRRVEGGGESAVDYNPYITLMLTHMAGEGGSGIPEELAVRAYLSFLHLRVYDFSDLERMVAVHARLHRDHGPRGQWGQLCLRCFKKYADDKRRFPPARFWGEEERRDRDRVKDLLFKATNLGNVLEARGGVGGRTAAFHLTRQNSVVLLQVLSGLCLPSLARDVYGCCVRLGYADSNVPLFNELVSAHCHTLELGDLGVATRLHDEALARAARDKAGGGDGEHGETMQANYGECNREGRKEPLGQVADHTTTSHLISGVSRCQSYHQASSFPNQQSSRRDNISRSRLWRRILPLYLALPPSYLPTPAGCRTTRAALHCFYRACVHDRVGNLAMERKAGGPGNMPNRMAWQRSAAIRKRLDEFVEASRGQYGDEQWLVLLKCRALLDDVKGSVALLDKVGKGSNREEAEEAIAEARARRGEWDGLVEHVRKVENMKN